MSDAPKQPAAESFRNPTDILPMGGGYDWRCFGDPRYSMYFLCKDDQILRDRSRWNTKGWSVCSIEMGDEAPIKQFTEYVAGLEAKLAIANSFRIGRNLRVEKRGDAWCVFDGLECLNLDGEWEPEPQPSSRSDEFIARTRFTRSEAFARGWAYVASMEKADG